MKRYLTRRIITITVLSAICVAFGVAVIWLMIMVNPPFLLHFFMGIMFTVSVVLLAWYVMDPDSSTARQNAELFQLSSQTLDCAKQGLTPEAAQKICELLLPSTPALAIAITDRENIIGYAGYNSENNTVGTPIRTTATHQTLSDGLPRILHSTKDIGLPPSAWRIGAAIIQPLSIGRSIRGTLKFYYHTSSNISETQKSISRGFAELLSSQMAVAALEEQTMLATSMELKALQAQINPHFLFNTINTIASLIRTDPNKARILLREFAVFYRSMLEDAEDLITLEREIKQVERYFSLEMARFGEDRLELKVNIEPEVYDMLVPSFMIQPIVENSVRHAMGIDGKLTVAIEGRIVEPNIVISVIDDGIGMSKATMATMLEKGSGTGMGIAMKNVKERMRAYYGPEALLEVKSELGKGTTVSFTLNKEVASRGFLKSSDVLDSAVPAMPNALNM